MHEYLARFTGEEGVLFIGRAQEKTGVFRTRETPQPATGTTYAWLVTLDRRWSTSSTSTAWTPTSARSSSSSAPTSPTTPSCASTATSGPNARPRRPGSGSNRWTTGSPPCEDPAAVQAICDTPRPEPDRRAAAQVAARSCRTRSPPADRAAGYRYELSILQAEFSLTQMLDRPVSGRIFFEQVIRDNLDIGRPDQVSLVFDRRIIRNGRTPDPGPVPHPGHHRRASPRACTSTTRTPRSSSTTRKDERYAPRPRSTTPATSGSANG